MARGAEKPFNKRVQDAVGGYPVPVITVLSNLELADASVTWDGVVRVTGMTPFGEMLLADLHRLDDDES